MTVTNNVTRLLDSKHVNYQIYVLPEEKLGAIETAKLLGISPSITYKTIVVVHPSKKPLLCVIPGDKEVDLKAVAAICGEKKVSLPTQAEAEQLTGLQAGGISPLALINKGFTVIIDTSASAYAAIHISGGQRGLNLKIGVPDLVNLTRARFSAISH
jgi:Cys-tRNA(Pro)/Cys-tRNA(Cys) deacylase